MPLSQRAKAIAKEVKHQHEKKVYRVTCLVKGKTQSFLLDADYPDFFDALDDFVEFVNESGLNGDEVESNATLEVAFFRSADGKTEIYMKREHA